MNILVVEDDDLKFNNIFSYLVGEKGISKSEITWKKSWHSGLLSILSNTYTLILLDMSMPRYDPDLGNVNEEFEPFAGQEILSEMKRKKILSPVVVITAFDYIGKDEHRMNSDELNKILKDDFSKVYLGMIKFNATSVEWKNKLDNYIKGVMDGNISS